MSKMLTASEQPISKVFSDAYLFKIPGYQRPYSWGTEQTGELFDDLREAMAAATGAVTSVTPYFLGSVVLVKGEDKADATVVDGQQRLTTLTLLLSALRTSLNDEKARTGLSLLIRSEANVIAGIESQYRLTLRERDLDFFRVHVQADAGLAKLTQLDQKLPDSQNNLRENAKLLLERIAQLTQNDRLRLAQFVATRCYLVMVCTPDLDSAYRIFDVLNSRGLDLTATDILKAEIVGKIPNATRATYTQKWEDVEANLGRDEFGNLFSHIRMIYRKAKPKGTLLKEFRDHVRYSSPEAFIDEKLTPMATAYSEIIDAAYSSQSGAEAVNRSLKWLNRVEFKDWMPPALLFLATYRNDADAIRTFFENLQRLVYGMLIAKWGVNERIERCSKLTAEIQANTDLVKGDAPLLLTIYEKKAIYDALDGPLYATHSARALSTILLRLNDWLSSGDASFDFEIVSVEHVLPQNPANDSEWMTWFPDNDTRANWTNRLGNLMLLSRRKNSSAGNREFAWKKKSYFTKHGIAPFPLTTEVLQYHKWTPDEVSAVQTERMTVFESRLCLQDRATTTFAPVEDKTSPKLANITGVFYCTASEADARAHCTEKGLVVLEGSTGRVAVVESFEAQASSVQLRANLFATGVIVDTGDGRIRFNQDYLFAAPSAAATLVTGRPADGWKEWRTADSLTLRDACKAHQAQ